MIKIDDLIVYDVAECAEMFKVSTATIRKYIRTGELKGQRVGNKFYVTQETIKNFLKGGTNNKNE